MGIQRQFAGRHDHTGGKPGRARQLWALGLMSLWLLGAAVGFWWFSLKDLRPFDALAAIGEQSFDAPRVTSDLERLFAESPAARDSGVTVMHFWDPGCACSRFNQAHVQQLVETYARHGVRFVVVGKQGTSSGMAAQETFGRYTQGFTVSPSSPLMNGIPASPAAAVFDGQGRLSYFGPYSEGAACLAGSGDFVEKILDRLLAGESPREIKTSVFGCFCDWARQV